MCYVRFYRNSGERPLDISVFQIALTEHLLLIVFFTVDRKSLLSLFIHSNLFTFKVVRNESWVAEKESQEADDTHQLEESHQGLLEIDSRSRYDIIDELELGIINAEGIEEPYFNSKGTAKEGDAEK